MQTQPPATVSSYLAGQVRKQTLPRIQPGTEASMARPALKRLMLPQGELAQLLDGSRAIRFLAFVELRAGTQRGNHFHKKKEEYFYLIAGRVDLWVEDVVTKARQRIPLEPGDLAFGPTGVAHTIAVLDAGEAVEFSEAPFDPQDTFRYRVGDPQSD